MIISKNRLSIYKITKLALFTEFLMNENKSDGDIICNGCTVTWDNYYDYPSKYFDDIISQLELETNS